MFILFSNLNKSIESYKYQISTLRNNKNISEKDKNLLKNNENIILYSKLLCRGYFIMEIAYLLRKYFKSTLNGKCFLLMALRINIIWFSVLYMTKVSLKTSIDKLTARARMNEDKSNNQVDSAFRNFIIHK